MPPAANIDEAINLVVTNAVARQSAGTLNASYVLWLNVFAETLPTSGPPFSPFDEASLGNRVARNWQFDSNILLAALPADPTTTFADASLIADNLFRMLNAVRTSEIDGDITVGQRDAVVSQYNLAWA